MNKCCQCGKSFNEEIEEYLVYLPTSSIAQSCCCEECAKALVLKEREKLTNKLNKFDNEAKVYKFSHVELNLKGE